MAEIVPARICRRAQQEEASVNGSKNQGLGDSANVILFQEIEEAFVMQAEDYHAEQVFENTDRGKNMEESVLCSIAVKPEIARCAKDDRPDNARNKEGAKKNPQSSIALLEKPAAKPGRNRIAKEETGKGPGRLIQFHAQIGNDRPGQRQVQKEATPRVNHGSDALGKIDTKFVDARKMVAAAQLKRQDHKHENGHGEMQAVQF